MKKICVVTGTRAEYGLLYQLMKLIKNDSEFELQIIVTGMHLSPEFGLTYEQIEEDGFLIDKKIENVTSSDTAIGISKSMGLAQISFSEAYDELKPDLIVLLGDRTEIFSAAAAALVACVPIAHIHGGEITEGAYDDAIRHSLTKMSHVHFTSTEKYRERVIQLGEHPSTVFNVGAIGLDNIQLLDLLSREEFEKSINHKLGKKNILITFHPVTLEQDTAEEQFRELLLALDQLDDTLLIFTKPNSDKDGRIIVKMIDEFVLNHPNSIAYTSLGQIRYLSALQYVDAVLGNSSSGIVEVPAFNIPTVNVGDRQKGRICAKSIIHCSPNRKDVKEALLKAFSKEFREQLKVVKDNPYGDGGCSEKIMSILKKEFFPKLVHKTFYDLK